MQLVWCIKCRRAIAWALMADSESPNTLYELAALFLPQDEDARVSYDAGCHLHSFILNRDPELLKRLQVFIDALHFKGHTCCSANYSTGMSVLRSDHCKGLPIICTHSSASYPCMRHCEGIGYVAYGRYACSCAALLCFASWQ